MTKPTTINAITDMPAKMPRPIGSTEIFFPGIWKAASAEEDGEEEVLSATVTAAGPLLLVVDLGGVAVVVVGKGSDEVVDGKPGGEVSVAVGSATVERPLTAAPGFMELEDVVSDEEVDVEVVELVDSVPELLGG